MTIRRLRSVPLLALVLFATALASCSSGDDGYAIQARFTRAVALYEGAQVLVMGIDVGTVDTVETDADGVLVSMTINEDVPLPEMATAAIVPASLIGERNVVLGPSWRKGEPRLAAGALIPADRTIIPVEPDEALESITNLLRSLDPASVRRLLEESAGALDGNGATINSALVELATLLPYLAEQDDELLAIADDIGILADVVRARDAQIGKLLDNFAIVADTLADERDSLVAFLDSLSSLTAQGQALLTAYEVIIPEGLDTIASVALTVQVNSESVKNALLALRTVQDGVLDAYNPDNQTVRARIYVNQALLGPLSDALEALGVTGIIGCGILGAIDPTCTP